MRKGLVFAVAIVFLLCFSAIAISSNLFSFNVLGDKKGDPTGPSEVTVIAGGWGASADEFGRDEQGIDGPSSFTVDKNGDVYVLDQINERIKKYDSAGKLLDVIKIARPTFEDVAVAADDSIYVLDPILKKVVVQLSSKGEPLKEVKLNDKIKFATSLQVQDNDVFAEDQHTHMYKIVGNKIPLSPDSQIKHKVPGRIKRDKPHAHLTATRANKTSFDINSIDASGRTALKIKTESKRNVSQLLLLDSDSKGNIYVAMEVYEEGSAPEYKLNSSQIIVAKYDGLGKLVGQIELPNDYETALFKKLTIDDEGSIYQLQTRADGVRVVKWRITT